MARETGYEAMNVSDVAVGELGVQEHGETLGMFYFRCLPPVSDSSGDGDEAVQRGRYTGEDHLQ